MLWCGLADSGCHQSVTTRSQRGIALVHTPRPQHAAQHTETPTQMLTSGASHARNCALRARGVFSHPCPCAGGSRASSTATAADSGMRPRLQPIARPASVCTHIGCGWCWVLVSRRPAFCKGEAPLFALAVPGRPPSAARMRAPCPHLEVQNRERWHELQGPALRAGVAKRGVRPAQHAS